MHGGWSSIWTILAFSTLIAKNINSIYPPVNGKKDGAYLTLNFTVEPVITSNEVINIMWKNQSKHKGGIWTPNHFVPVIKGKDEKIIVNPVAYGTPSGYDTKNNFKENVEDVEEGIEPVQVSKLESCIEGKVEANDFNEHEMT